VETIDQSLAEKAADGHLSGEGTARRACAKRRPSTFQVP
jgi:hypothetical protein